MNIFIWIVAGGIAGWVGYKYLHANEDRGMTASIIIGIAGGLIGGYLLAPMLGETVLQPGDFSPFALFIAAACAAASLTIGNMLSTRFDI